MPCNCLLYTSLLENGKTATREVVHHHGGACILPYFADGTICMVRQFRYAMQHQLWDPVSYTHLYGDVCQN